MNKMAILSTQENILEKFFGTLVMDYNYQVFWSSKLWHSAFDGLQAQPKQWLCLGSSTWWANPSQKETYLFVKELVGEDNLPTRPREEVVFLKALEVEQII